MIHLGRPISYSILSESTLTYIDVLISFCDHQIPHLIPNKPAHLVKNNNKKLKLNYKSWTTLIGLEFLLN